MCQIEADEHRLKQPLANEVPMARRHYHLDIALSDKPLNALGNCQGSGVANALGSRQGSGAVDKGSEFLFPEPMAMNMTALKLHPTSPLAQQITADVQGVLLPAHRPYVM